MFVLLFLFVLIFTDALNIPSELESALRLRTVQYFITKRPWLGNSSVIPFHLIRTSVTFLMLTFLFFFFFFVSDLYGVHVRPVAPFGSTSSKPQFDPALIHRSLPDELLFEVGLDLPLSFFSFLFQTDEVDTWIYIFVGICSDVAL